IFGHMHVKLNNGETFGWHLQSREVRDRFLGDQDTAGMHAALVGEFLQQFAVFVHQPDHGILFMFGHRFSGQHIQFVFGKSKYFPYFAEDGAVFKFNIGSAESHMVPSVFIKYILKDGIPVLPAPVYIEIGRTVPVQVQEPFKIKIQFNGTYIRNTQAVTHDTVGPAAPPHNHETYLSTVLLIYTGDENLSAETVLVTDYH